MKTDGVPLKADGVLSQLRVFVSSRFGQAEYSSFLAQLIVSLTRQNLRPYIYRSYHGRIAAGEDIKERNCKDVADCDVFVVIASPHYAASQACIWEAEMAAAEQVARRLPVVMAVWPGMPQQIKDWPAELRALLVLQNGCDAPRTMVFNLSPKPGLEDAEELCRDVCKRLGVEFRNERDPSTDAHEMAFIRRTRRLLRAFPLEKVDTLDGDLTDLLRDLVRHHGRAARKGRTNYGELLSDISEIRTCWENRFSPSVMSYLRLGEAVYGYLEARALAADRAAERIRQARSSAKRALRDGDPFTQRDTCIFLGSLALYLGQGEKALLLYELGSRIAHLIENGRLDHDGRWTATKLQLFSLSRFDALCPVGPSAYVMFDNMMRARIQLLRFPEIYELRLRKEEWERGFAYSDLDHYERLAALLAFGFAIVGDVEEAEDILARSIEGKEALHLDTWHSLLQLLCNGLNRHDAWLSRDTVDGLEWMAFTLERLDGDAGDIARCNFEMAFIGKRLGRHDLSVKALSRALASFPVSIRLLVERAESHILAGDNYMAYCDCIAAVNLVAGSEETFAPFGGGDQPFENYFAQGLAYWFLGRRDLAKYAYRQSSHDHFYSSYYEPNWEGILHAEDENQCQRS